MSTISNLFRKRTSPSHRQGKLFFGLRIGIFTAIVVLEISMLLLSFWMEDFYGLPRWPFILGTIGIFTLSVALQTFVFDRFSYKIACYVVDVLAQFVLTLLIGNVYLCAVYVLVLSEYYMSTDKIFDNLTMAIACILVFVATYGYATYGDFDIFTTIVACFSELLVLAIHFVIVNFALYSYDTKQELEKSLKERDESSQKLQKAYDELAEVTLLQERQRIAKDIHDTAGHSITTVIMQTEAAKLLLEEDREAAKRSIVAANLQAKNALEELRRSVHLLAGTAENTTLRDKLLRVVNDTSDGTGIVIRADIENITCVEAKERLLVNSLKEGISNGLRHGRATAFYVELYSGGGNINFLLSDNGVGADVAHIKEGLGIRGMRERTEALGGKLYLTSMLDEGFEIRIVLPADAVKNNM